MLIQFPEVSPYYGPWYITKHCQVSFKRSLAPLVFLTTEPLHFLLLEKTGELQLLPEIHLLNFQWILVGYFMIFFSVPRSIALCLPLYVPPMQVLKLRIICPYSLVSLGFIGICYIVDNTFQDGWNNNYLLTLQCNLYTIPTKRWGLVLSLETGLAFLIEFYIEKDQTCY